MGEPCGKYLMTVIHVDDFLVAGDCEETVDKFVLLIQQKYTIQQSKNAKKFLSLCVENLPEGDIKFT